MKKVQTPIIAKQLTINPALKVWKYDIFFLLPKDQITDSVFWKMAVQWHRTKWLIMRDRNENPGWLFKHCCLFIRTARDCSFNLSSQCQRWELITAFWINYVWRTNQQKKEYYPGFTARSKSKSKYLKYLVGTMLKCFLRADMII